MYYSRLRGIVKLRNQINAPLRVNPFVFSKTFFLWVLLGVIGGIVAGLYWLVLGHLIGWISILETPSEVVFIMTGGDLLAGLVIHFMGDPGEMELVVDNIRFKGGRLDPGNNLSMFFSSLICIGTGGNAGPESPLVQITGSIGSWMAKKLKLKGEDFRSMSIAGMASGFTALFGAPLGGSLIRPGGCVHP
ncbi:MAG: chloride channel protein [Chitinophagaceae bacterium]